MCHADFSRFSAHLPCETGIIYRGKEKLAGLDWKIADGRWEIAGGRRRWRAKVGIANPVSNPVWLLLFSIFYLLSIFSQYTHARSMTWPHEH
jgi:hypothetical protein